MALDPMKTLGMLAAILALSSNAVRACPNLSEKESIESAEQDQAEVQAAVADILSEADLVFIGRLLDVKEQTELRSSIDGDPREIETTWVTLEVLGRIKGDSGAIINLMFERDLGVIEVGCNSLVGFREVSFISGKGYRYLVYSKNGVVLRENTVVDWYSELTSQVELEMLRKIGAQVPE